MSQLRYSWILALCALPVWPRANECVSVDSQIVRARDLASVVPAFQHIDESTAFGYAPVPGQRRLIRAMELEHALKKHGIPVAGGSVASSVCIERLVSVLPESSWYSALRRALAGRPIEMEVIELPRILLPPGDVVFSLVSLPRANNADTPVVWRGTHTAKDGKRTPVWARVILAEDRCRLTAKVDLRLGAAVTPSVVQKESFRGFPGTEPVRDCSSDFFGRVLRRSLSAGSIISSRYLDEAIAVRRGEAVTVEVSAGSARLVLKGTAETSAKVGQRLTFSTAMSKRAYVGTVKEKGRVSVELPD